MRTSKTKKLSKKKAWRIFSEYIRRKYADDRGFVRCVTCRKWMHWQKAHAGHFMSRRYESTLFDEKNVAPQCASCNTFNQGRQYQFGKWIDEQFGEGTAEKLEVKSKMRCHRKQIDYEYISLEYKNKLKKIEKTKIFQSTE